MSDVFTADLSAGTLKVALPDSVEVVLDVYDAHDLLVAALERNEKKADEEKKAVTQVYKDWAATVTATPGWSYRAANALFTRLREEIDAEGKGEPGSGTPS